MSTPAQDEFNQLMSSNTERRTQHPEDAAADSETDFSHSSTTLAATPTSRTRSGKPSKSSLKSSLRNRDSSDEDDDLNYGRQTKRNPYYIPNNHGYNENTGPKGVISDARNWEYERRMGNKNTYIRTENMVLPKGQHLHTTDGDQQQQQQQRRGKSRTGDEEDDELDDEDDTDFMRRWRERRQEELQAGKLNTAPGGRKGRYGRFRTVDAMGFLEVVEKTPRETVVVVYVFDDQLRVSQGYHEKLEDLAARYSDTRFVALHYLDAEIEHAGVPALLAYRNGEQFASLTPLVEEVPFTCNVVTTLEQVLRGRGIL